MNKHISKILVLCYIMVGCATTSSLQRKVLIIDSITNETLSFAQVSFANKDTLYSLQTELIADTLEIELKSALYTINCIVVGYKSVRENIRLKKDDKLLKISLEPIELEDVNVNWEGASILIKDNFGNVKCVKIKSQYDRKNSSKKLNK